MLVIHRSEGQTSGKGLKYLMRDRGLPQADRTPSRLFFFPQGSELISSIRRWKGASEADFYKVLAQHADQAGERRLGAAG